MNKDDVTRLGFVTHKLEHPADVAAAVTHDRTQAETAEELDGVAALVVVVDCAPTSTARTAAKTATMSLALANIVADTEMVRGLEPLVGRCQRFPQVKRLLAWEKELRNRL